MDKTTEFAIIGAKTRIAELKAEIASIEAYVDNLHAADDADAILVHALAESDGRRDGRRNARARRKHSRAFKLKVTNWVIASEGSMSAAAKRFDVAPSVVAKWVKEAKQTKRGIRR